MKEERKKLTSQKYKGLQKNTMNNYMPKNWKTWKMDKFLEKYNLPSESGRIRESGQTDYNY